MSRGAIRIVGAAMIAGFAAAAFGIRDQNWLLLALFEAAAVVVGALGIRDYRSEQR